VTEVAKGATACAGGAAATACTSAWGYMPQPAVLAARRPARGAVGTARARGLGLGLHTAACSCGGATTCAGELLRQTAWGRGATRRSLQLSARRPTPLRGGAAAADWGVGLRRTTCANVRGESAGAGQKERRL
jgi:hypothetical protein